MDAERRCSQCGQVIPWSQAECPRCTERGSFLGSLSRETILLLCTPVLLVLFALTSFTAKIYHSEQTELAREWHARGEADLKAGQAGKAIEDFTKALVYSRGNARYRLRLAQAMIAANQVEEARPYLLRLWEQAPGDGTVNLELARLAVRTGAVSEAIRYFQNAVYGVWERDPEKQRRQVRLELCDYLLGQGLRNDAQAVLIPLAADLPKDTELYARVGTLFLRAEDYSHALDAFRQALRLDQRDYIALTGAGEAAFQMANYREAQRYLARAVRLTPQGTHAAQRLEMTSLILSVDPLERGLSSQERTRRVVRAYQQAVERLRDCAMKRGQALGGPQPMTDLQAAYARAMQMRPSVRETVLQRNSDLLMRTLELVFEIEELTARDCGHPADVDLALLLIARKRGGAEQ
jgi:tetratricopeptide (TPR) repeat protein